MLYRSIQNILTETSKLDEVVRHLHPPPLFHPPSPFTNPYPYLPSTCCSIRYNTIACIILPRYFNNPLITQLLLGVLTIMHLMSCFFVFVAVLGFTLCRYEPQLLSIFGAKHSCSTFRWLFYRRKCLHELYHNSQAYCISFLSICRS